MTCCHLALEGRRPVQQQTTGQTHAGAERGGLRCLEEDVPPFYGEIFGRLAFHSAGLHSLPSPCEL